MSHDHHIIPKSTLLKVFGALIVLTVVTYAVAQFDLGPLDIPVAIGIASVKAGLVVAIFMALKYDNPVNAMTFSVGTIFVVVFITFTLFDTAFRGDLGNVSSRTKTEIDQQREQAQEADEAIPADRLRVTPADYPDEGASSSGEEAPGEEASGEEASAGEGGAGEGGGDEPGAP
jgi:cytochrome c oxidase subunit 4